MVIPVAEDTNTWALKHEEITLALNWKLHPYQPAFKMREVLRTLPEEKRNPESYRAVNSASYNDNWSGKPLVW